MNNPVYLNYPRHLEARLIEAMQDTPAVFVTGPRQAGKTTLVKKIAAQHIDLPYFTLDDELTLLAAQQNPAGMIRDLKGNGAVIDEIQRAPQLLLSIKKTIDEHRRPGRFLLTGSAHLMVLPQIADSLAGRVETLTLWPLSQSEIRGTHVNWIDHLFDHKKPQPIPDQSPLGDDLVDLVLKGGYPQAISRKTFQRRATWARQYIDAMVQRDVREIAHVDRLDPLPRFLKMLAQVSGQMCNYSQLGVQVGLDHKTTARYMGIFEQMYLLERIQGWSTNRLHRVVKTPKMQFIDSGLLSALLDLTPALAQKDRSIFGKVLETFVFSELRKHAANASSNYQLLYYRDHDQYEVDIVIENARGQCVAVEVKAAASLQEKDWRSIKRFAAVAKDQLELGVILYDGTQTIELNDHLWALPLSSLWGR